MESYSFLEFALALREGLHGLDPLYQVLALAGIVGITILILALTYQIIKGSLYLTYYIVKGSAYIVFYSVKFSLLLTWYICKGTYYLCALPFKMFLSRPIDQPSLTTASPEAVQQQTTQVSAHFCPNCGKQFTSIMEYTIHRTGECFCESCGTKAQITA